MILERFPVGPIESNCYIIGCEDTKKGAVIDPGADGDKILKQLERLGLQCEKIILTHGHVDHIGALNDVHRGTGAQVMIHKDDSDMLKDPGKNLSMFMGSNIQHPGPDQFLNEGDKISIGNVELEVIHTPGHTPGGICLKGDGMIITGDTLFAGSVGRSDFPGGNHNTLIDSIKKKLLIYDDNTKVYPGHGPTSTIGTEKKVNPFLN